MLLFILHFLIFYFVSEVSNVLSKKHSSALLKRWGFRCNCARRRGSGFLVIASDIPAVCFIQGPHGRLWFQVEISYLDIHFILSQTFVFALLETDCTSSLADAFLAVCIYRMICCDDSQEDLSKKYEKPFGAVDQERNPASLCFKI